MMCLCVALVVSLQRLDTARGQPATDTAAPTFEVRDQRFEFATPERGAEILQTPDIFVRQFSEFDWQARAQDGDGANQQNYLEFVGEQVRAWDETSLARMEKALQLLQAATKDLELPVGEPIEFVLTNGKDESGAAYTRGSAIVLPAGMQSPNPTRLARLIAHEWFHVLSRRNPELRDQLYAIIGFRHVGPVQFPQDLEPRRMTNPDAPLVEHAIDIQLNGQTEITVAPITFAKAPYNREKMRSMFRYMVARLMQVEAGEDGQWRGMLKDNEPILLESDQPDFWRQIGRNTRYVVHPEETLADNFAILVMGDENVPDPWVIEKLRDTLATAANDGDAK